MIQFYLPRLMINGYILVNLLSTLSLIHSYILSIVNYANVKVSEARKRKNRRLKQAKEEAQQEIEKYKQERERTFK